MAALNEEDQSYLLHLLGPQHMMPLAKRYGAADAVRVAGPEALLGDDDWVAVLGAKAASDDVRTKIREYARFVRWRDGKRAVDLTLATCLRHMGYVGGYQPLYLLRDLPQWRTTAQVFWPRGVGAEMDGTCRIPVGDARQHTVDAAVVKAISDLFARRPLLNRAMLQGKLWQRTTAHVMVHLEPRREQIRSVILDASKLPLEKVVRRLGRAVRAAVRAEKHELRGFVAPTLHEWGRTGFISSPAAAMISLVGSKGGIVEGHAPILTDVNGVGISFTAGKVEDGVLVLGAIADHRVWDGEQMSQAWKFLRSRIPEILGREAT